ncbi:MAG TPA: hypothetical protein VFV24_05750 [Candidatus Eisenbacteria bacterium]|nr:hypothetical protein [Candidatus Eisenbacteria bacterium]
MIRRFGYGLARAFARLWALPMTVLGALLLPLAWMSGGKVAVVDGVVEVHGGWITGFLRRWPPFTAGAAAMALGHVVLAMSARDMEECRAHERVHVRQCERWGIFFLPAYLGASLWAVLRGRDPYRDNPFEREAFDASRPGASARIV